MLRDLEDYRCKVYDQLQSNCQEFEAENQQLIQRHQLATEQIKRLKMLSDEQELQELCYNNCIFFTRFDSKTDNCLVEQSLNLQ